MTINILNCNKNFVQHLFIKVIASVDFCQVALKVLNTQCEQDFVKLTKRILQPSNTLPVLPTKWLLSACHL